MASSESEEAVRLRNENIRLIALLETNGIEWRLPRQLAIMHLTTCMTTNALNQGAISGQPI